MTPLRWTSNNQLSTIMALLSSHWPQRTRTCQTETRDRTTQQPFDGFAWSRFICCSHLSYLLQWPNIKHYCKQSFSSLTRTVTSPWRQRRGNCTTRGTPSRKEKRPRRVAVRNTRNARLVTSHLLCGCVHRATAVHWKTSYWVERHLSYPWLSFFLY